jgi:DNA invertase Pin-like site-specific DNA recombinase
MANRARRSIAPPPTLAEAPRTFSYTRFSSNLQADGDSLARQMRLAQEWCISEGVTLDPLTLHDAGRSAYHSRHLEEGGALAAFLALVEDGTIPRGSRLLVEGFDRLSRAAPRKAFMLLNRLVDAGIEVVTLADKQRYMLRRWIPTLCPSSRQSW